MDEHGGLTGVRDPGLLASASARPRNAAEYGRPDAPELAALYALGVIRNHPFFDGNRRVATVLLEIFLVDNGYQLVATDEDLFHAVMSAAAGETPEDDLISWVRAHAHRGQADGRS